ncbi:MAG: type II toxin-antitoxin system HicB family antitoxin [Chloroflexia bacterium]
MQHRYLIVVEQAEGNYSAYAPDVPGCATTGSTIEETLANMQEALELYLEVNAERGEIAPKAYSVDARFVEVSTKEPQTLSQTGKSA